MPEKARVGVRLLLTPLAHSLSIKTKNKNKKQKLIKIKQLQVERLWQGTASV